MRFKFSPLTNEENTMNLQVPTLKRNDKTMNVAFKLRPRNAADAVAVARAKIEREFSVLIEQQPRLVHLALNEAEALAWESGFPELVFPLLAQEKAGQVASWHEHQKSFRQTWPSHAFAA